MPKEVKTLDQQLKTAKQSLSYNQEQMEWHQQESLEYELYVSGCKDLITKLETQIAQKEEND